VQATGLEMESSFVRQAAINVEHLNFLHQKQLTRKHFQRAHRLFQTARMGDKAKRIKAYLSDKNKRLSGAGTVSGQGDGSGR